MLGSLGANYTEDVILTPAAVPCCFFYPDRHAAISKTKVLAQGMREV